MIPRVPRRPAHGFTLIEVLVAIAILAVVIALSSAIIASLTANGRSRAGLGVNQAAQQYIEGMTRTWLDPAAFGTITSSSVQPATLSGSTWEVTACQVAVPTDPAASTFPCAPAPLTVTYTAATAGTVTLRPTPDATLMRLTVTYRPTGAGTPLTTTTEFSRR